jgi:D-alanyl-D-alanine carboxypeptidase
MLTSFLNLYATVALASSDVNIGPNTNNAVPAYEQALPASMIPVKKDHAIMPVIEADAAIIVDFESGSVIFEKNSSEKLQIASITKLMTAIVALEKGNIDDTVSVSTEAALTEGSKVWLYGGEQITLRNLLYAVLIHSGNDAAVAVAEHVAGDVDSFVSMMNEKADKLGLMSTKFQNPIGFDNINNYSTVHDLALLARYAYRKPFIQNAVKNKTMTISSVSGELTHDLESTNKLLGSFLNVLGLKTGHTSAAGLCFVSIIDNGSGNKIITVVLNSPARFEETKKMASWAFRSHIW